MEMESQTQAPETSTQASPQVESSPQAAAAPQLSSVDSDPSAQNTVLSQDGKPSWEPNYKFKANGQEFEIDEEYRAYIKSQDDEKKIKRMFEQFKGVDSLKERWKQAETQAKEFQSKYENYEQSLSAINQLAQKGDIMKALQYLGFNEDMILQAAKQALDFRDLPEQAKQIHTQAQQQERFAQEMFMRNQAIEQQLYQAKAQMRAAELESTLSSSEIKDFQSRFDAAHGPGSFRQEVINEAQAEYLRTQSQTGQGVDISAKDAVERVLRKLKPFLASQQAQAQGSASDAPVIPTTKPGSTSPVAKSFKSLEEIQNYRKQKFGY